jgi:hypothetical protein
MFDISYPVHNYLDLLTGQPQANTVPTFLGAANANHSHLHYGSQHWTGQMLNTNHSHLH